MPLSDNLRRAYRFAEAGGSTADDEGADAADGTIVGSAALGGGLLDLPSGGSCISVTSLALTGDWTIAFRGKQDSSGTAGVLCGNRSATTAFIFFHGGDKFKVQIGATEYGFAGVTTFTTTADYCVVYDGTADELRLYKDGSHVETKTSVTTGTFTVTGVGSGYNSDSFSLVGELDYWYAWDRALSGTEAADVDTDPDSMFAAAAVSVTPRRPLRQTRNRSLLTR